MNAYCSCNLLSMHAYMRCRTEKRPAKFNDFYNPFRKVLTCSNFFLIIKPKTNKLLSLRVWEKERERQIEKVYDEKGIQKMDDIQVPTIQCVHSIEYEPSQKANVHISISAIYHHTPVYTVTVLHWSSSISTCFYKTYAIINFHATLINIRNSHFTKEAYKMFNYVLPFISRTHTHTMYTNGVSKLYIAQSYKIRMRYTYRPLGFSISNYEMPFFDIR